MAPVSATAHNPNLCIVPVMQSFT